MMSRRYGKNVSKGAAMYTVSQPVLVLNIKTGEQQTVKDIRQAARIAGTDAHTIYNYIKDGKAYRKTYCFDYALPESKAVLNDW